MTLNRLASTLALAGLLTATGAALASAQSTGCRLFPLACPGATPAPPPPLMGPPDDAQPAAAEPAPAPRRKHAAHKPAAAPRHHVKKTAG